MISNDRQTEFLFQSGVHFSYIPTLITFHAASVVKFMAGQIGANAVHRSMVLWDGTGHAIQAHMEKIVTTAPKSFSLIIENAIWTHIVS